MWRDTFSRFASRVAAFLPLVPRKSWSARIDGTSHIRSAAAVMYMTTDSTGTVFLTCQETHSVWVFGPDGVLCRKWGSFGRLEGEFDKPRGIAVQDDLLAVVDSHNRRVQVFTKVGRFVVAWPLCVDVTELDSIVFVPNTETDPQVLVTNYRPSRLLRFRLATGKLLGTWSFDFTLRSLKFLHRYLLLLGTVGRTEKLAVYSRETHTRLVLTAVIPLQHETYFGSPLPWEFVVWDETTLLVTDATRSVRIFRLADGARLQLWETYQLWQFACPSGLTAGTNHCIHLGALHNAFLHVMTLQLDV